MSDTLTRLAAVLETRKGAAPDSSYVASLYHKGLNKILEKLGEESIETILAAKDAALVPDPLAYADLMATGDGRCIETAKLIFEQIVRADA